MTSKATMPTDNPTHAELVGWLHNRSRELGSYPNRFEQAASIIESQASRIKELEAENKRQAEALQAIDRIVGENIKDNGTDINRMNIKGEWFTGPPVDACFRILRGLQEVARAALGGKP